MAIEFVLFNRHRAKDFSPLLFYQLTLQI